MNISRALVGPALAAPMLFFAGWAWASPQTDGNVTAEIAAARLGAACGVEIVLPPNTTGRVSLEAADPGSRLQSVNALATALGLDFTKTYVVRNAAGGRPVMPKIDSLTSVPFGTTTLPAAEAIALVAGVDDASALTAGDIGGTVTLSASTLPAAQAAQEIAEQTKTSWRTIYTLAPRPGSPARDGRLVGRTAAGTPIFVMPAIYFIDWKKNAQIRREQEAAEQRAMQQAEQAQAAAQQQSSQQLQAVAAAQATLRSAGVYGSNASGAPAGLSPSAGTGAYGPNNGPIITGNGF